MFGHLFSSIQGKYMPLIKHETIFSVLKETNVIEFATKTKRIYILYLEYKRWKVENHCNLVADSDLFK